MKLNRVFPALVLGFVLMMGVIPEGRSGTIDMEPLIRRAVQFLYQVPTQPDAHAGIQDPAREALRNQLFAESALTTTHNAAQLLRIRGHLPTWAANDDVSFSYPESASVSVSIEHPRHQRQHAVRHYRGPVNVQLVNNDCGARLENATHVCHVTPKPVFMLLSYYCRDSDHYVGRGGREGSIQCWITHIQLPE